MEITKEIFEQTAKTGVQVLVLRDIGECGCLSKVPDETELDVLGDSMFGDVIDDIEKADPKCPTCLGTGKQLFKILTNKIRTTDVNAVKTGGTASEVQAYELLKDDNLILYFPFNYDFLTMKDYIATIRYDNANNLLTPIAIENLFKIVDIVKFNDESFVYYRITASKRKED